MKRSTKFKFGLLILLGGVLLSFNQCINPVTNKSKNNLKFSDSSTGNSASGVTVSRAVSLDAFSRTVYTVTKNRCQTCHGNSQTPLHASGDVNIAYDAIMNSSKVDLNNPANSRIVLKLKNEKHNCWGSCTDNAAEIENQVISWKTIIGSSTTSTTTATNLSKTTKESLTITEVLNPNNSYDENTIHLMTESASLKSPMVKAIENGIDYIWVPSNIATKDLVSADSGIGYLNFTVKMSDFYRIYANVNASTDVVGMLYVKAAGSDYKEWNIGITKGFEWKEVTNTTAKLRTEFYMTAGKSYTLELRQKNSGLKISKVAITNDPSYDPTNVPKALLKSTISLPISDLTGVSDARFEIDIEDYDMYAYKISNPRIVSTKDIKIKKMKVLVNGSFNPQHATYLSVDKTITSQDNKLSSASMILLKDKGADMDKISFGFDTIEVVK